MRDVLLLDCTLRDGGHIVNSYFGKKVINSIVNNLQESGVEIIEVGFLQNCNFDENRAMFNSIYEAMQVIPPKKKNVQYSLMAQADLYDIENLEEGNNFIDIVRISFHDNHIKEGLFFCKRVIEKGYKCFVNPINLMGYSDSDILLLISEVNKLHPYAFTIVDTFGSLLKQDLRRFYYLLDHNLNKEIRIAVHLHENQALSYSLAQDFIELNCGLRDICIDGSLFGMGRVPGNLCIELIMGYLNHIQEKKYDLTPVFDAIDEHIMKIRQTHPWGYSTEYALSAKFKVHRSYAEYLYKKRRLKTKQINQILSLIDKDKATRFDKSYIEKLYITYQSNMVDDEEAIERLKAIFEHKDVLIIGPGKSIIENLTVISDIASKENVIVILANFIWKTVNSDFCLFTNIRRWDEFKNELTQEKVIMTSNLLDYNITSDYIINYSDFAFYREKLIDNCLAIALKLLKTINCTEIYLAGFDGFDAGSNFAIPSMENIYEEEFINKTIRELVRDYKTDMNIHFVTSSRYEE